MTITAPGLSRGSSAPDELLRGQHVDPPEPLVRRCLEIPQPGQRGAAQVAGVVDQQVEPAVLGGGGDEGRPVGRVGDVTGDGADRVSAASSSAARSSGSGRRASMVRVQPSLGQREGQRAAQPGGGAGDQCVRHALQYST